MSVALSFVPADHFLLIALVLNITLLIQWTLVKRAEPQLALTPLIGADLPNPSWLEPFSRDRALRRTRIAAPRKKRSQPRVTAPTQHPQRSSTALPSIKREQILL